MAADGEKEYVLETGFYDAETFVLRRWPKRLPGADVPTMPEMEWHVPVSKLGEFAVAPEEQPDGPKA